MQTKNRMPVNNIMIFNLFKKQKCDPIYIVSVNNNDNIYKKCILNNLYANKYSIIEKENKANIHGVAELYNNFLNSYNFANDAWIVFCHNDFELFEDICKKLIKLKKIYLYGPFGVKLIHKTKNYYIKEYRGRVFEKNRDGTNLRSLSGKTTKDLSSVDAFDAQCLIVHTSLINKFNLRFDEKFKYDLYVEDFCISAKELYNIESKIINIKCCHWSQINHLNEIRTSYFESMNIFYKKYNNSKFKFTLHGNDNGNMLIKYILPEIEQL